MKELRLAWEPENRTPLADIEERCSLYMSGKDSGVTLLSNGTWLFTPNGRDDEGDARKAMEEAKFLVDFNVVEMKLGGYLVGFHHAIAVFVSKEEFAERREEIRRRKFELMFPEEHFSGKSGVSEDHLLIGLYARGKLQRDAFNPRVFKRIVG